MAAAVAEDALSRGHEALASGNWDGARSAFQEALDLTDSPEALDGLGRALTHRLERPTRKRDRAGKKASELAVDD